jgi:hypothetical protein
VTSLWFGLGIGAPVELNRTRGFGASETANMEIDFAGVDLMAKVLWAILKIALLMLASMTAILATALLAEKLVSRARRRRDL